MRRLHPLALGFVLSAIAALTLSPAAAQTRGAPLKIIYPFPGGGSGDALTRLIAEQLGARLNRTVIVEPRAGAGGRLGVQAAKAAEADGTTLLVSPIAPMAVYPSMYPALEYDPVKDFSPVSQLATFDLAVSIGPHVPATNLAELIAWLKANPAQANFGTPGHGTLPHFFGIMFARAAGITLQHVAYKGGSQALTDMMGGQIPIVFLSTNELAELHKANRLRVLATSDSRRSPFLPEVPTFRESGFEIEGTGWWGMFAPASTPPEIVARINAAIVETLAGEDIKEKVRRIGLQPTGTTPDELGRVQRDDIARWASAVKASGFKPEQ
jgi:tripartite-type tricarboxylate transporter receptor subunit TctC